MASAERLLRGLPESLANSAAPERPYLMMEYMAKLDPIHFMHMANVPHTWDNVKYMKVRIVVLAEAYQYYQTEQTRQA